MTWPHLALRRKTPTTVLIGLVGLTVVALCQARVAHRSQERVVGVPELSAPRPVALVLGAGLLPDGQPTPMLAERVDAAVALYRAGQVRHLLMSGDNSAAGYDEPTSMRRRALDAGVPAADITVDFAGFSTLDSCQRARRIFTVGAAVVITQDFHAPRAVTTCRDAGIDAVGVGLSSAHYGRVEVAGLRVREAAAAIKATWDHVSENDPVFLGPVLGLGGTEQLPPVNQRFDARLRALGVTGN
ncbi:MAG: vancomycin high temperature exclusion protein [Acidimicrobiales bacterium]